MILLFSECCLFSWPALSLRQGGNKTEAYHLCAVPSVLWFYHARVPSSKHPAFHDPSHIFRPRLILYLTCSHPQGRGRGDGRPRGGGGKPRGEISLLKLVLCLTYRLQSFNI